MKRLMHPTTRLFIAAAIALSVPSVQSAEKEPPPHPSVGQRFVPADVDWSHPVYATTFDNADVLADWKL